MPCCVQCDNRHFSSKEALLQHIRSSSAYHPYCDSCDRRFVSKTAHDAHMAAKHPPTFDCTLCNRPYHAPFALEDHYRGSSLHPNCTKCGRGFRDQAAIDEHHATAHIKVPCAPCGGMSMYEDELASHYWNSPSHPKCQGCKLGFKDDLGLLEHISSAHPDQHCTQCNTGFEKPELLQTHFWASPLHPKCERCRMGFLNAEAQNFHLETVHTPTALATLPIHPEEIDVQVHEPAKLLEPSIFHEAIPLMQTNSLNHTGFTPLSPKNPLQSLIVGERRINSPDLRVDARFSPIIDIKPPFSPALPRPGHKIEEIWSSTENVQVPAGRQLPPTPPRSANGNLYSTRPPNYSYTVPYTWNDNLLSREVRRPVSRLSAPGLDFHSRLYPGSARAASISQAHRGLLTEANVDPSPTNGYHRVGSASISGASFWPSGPYSQIRRPRTARSEVVDWEELMGSSQFQTQPSNSANAPSPTAAVCASPALPMRRIGNGSGSRDTTQLLTPSPPSLATTSSPASSAVGHSPIGSGSYDIFSSTTRPTTASSTPMSQTTPVDSFLVFTVTPTSECSSPVPQPDLSSPVSLKSLPSMSPLAGTPLDIDDGAFYYPETQHPLPDSPETKLRDIDFVDAIGATATNGQISAELASFSKVVAIFDATETPSQLSPPRVPSSLSSSSAHSYITSPQEPHDADTEMPSPSAPTPVPVPVIPPHELETAALEAAFDLVPGGDDGIEIETDSALDQSHSFDTVVASPVTPIPPGDGGEPPAEDIGRRVEKTNPNPLHCRACLADSCDDITASMCGHIFCNRCITDAVIKTSRCPVCSTPTLLYCLFRLDLAA